MKKIQPALFDKLTLRHHGYKKSAWREWILRDIECLLNDASRSAQLQLKQHSFCMSSVLNYGLPSLSKRIPINTDPMILARHIQNIIATFEPRLEPESIRVVPILDTDQAHVLAILFDIFGVCLFSGEPETVNLRIALDYSCGAVKVLE
ncbi:type VI secretion system baseplate subunit TssE [Cedecea sp.]|jgi:type VI secretion system protein ImpF|uniref:type VI secretion system baseplate subunit TssE n=1 Tax=Cedecea sp. TaxID=1970739 RepID=UPI0012ADA80F|nr:type VI secretion system baseplate subunit TssE [Enterobacteriaceae bacterium RIT693]